MKTLLAKDKAARDLIALGAMVIRLDPGTIPFEYASSFDLHVSGGEFNVAANLSRAFGQRTAIATAMVDYPLGLKIEAEVRKMGVHPFYKRFEHDGVRGPNMAHVYSDRGQGMRAPVVFYNRGDEAAARLKPDSFDYDELFEGGVRWVHSGGIFAALSKTTPELVKEFFRRAKAQGAFVSFDLNYRQKLWASLSDEPQKAAQKTFSEIVQYVDVLVGNEEDLQMGLGLKGPEVHSTDKLDPTAFWGMAEQAKKKFPNLKAVGTTMRVVHSTNRHDWSAVLYLDGKGYQAPTAQLDILDRVGGGDGFASGLIYGLLDGREPQEALNLGWAHGALLTTYPGDTTMAKLHEVEAFAAGGSARIQR